MQYRGKMYLFIVLIIFTLALTTITIVVKEFFFEENTQKIALNNALEQSKEREEIFQDFIEKSSETLYSLKNLQKFNSYLKNFNTKKEQELEDIFLAYSQSQPEFMQLRYIDKNGLEKLRIDRDKLKSIPYIVSKDKLQNKSNRYYFIDSKTKPLNKVWFSALDLNMEKGKVEIPFRPTLRAILPIKFNNKFHGILIINYFMEDFLNKFIHTPLYDMIMFNNKGYTLINYEDKYQKSWGNSLKHQYNIKADFKEDYQKILTNKIYQTKTYISRKLDVPIKNDIFLILKINHNYLKKQQLESNSQYFAISAITLIFAFFIIMIIIRFFSKTLLNIEILTKLNQNITVASKIAKIGFWEYHPSENKSIIWSDGIYDIFDIENRNYKLTYEKFLSFIPEQYQQKIDDELNSSIKEKREYYLIHEIISYKYIVKYVEARATHYYDKNGNYTNSLGSIIDITELKNTEQKLIDTNKEQIATQHQLEKQKKEFEYIFKYAQDGIVLMDEDTNFLDFNDAFMNMTRYTREELLNMNCKQLTAPEFLDQNDQLLDELSKNSKVQNIEKDFLIKDSKRITVLMSITVMPDKHRLLLTLKDITSVKILETQSKLAEMGEMIGSIAHQWRQPLSAISTSISALKVKNDLGMNITNEAITKTSDLILEQTKYLSDTIDDFRNFIKGDEEFKTLDIKQMVENSLKLTQAMMKSNFINMVVKLEDTLQINGNENELTQAIINILNNSKDAIKEHVKKDEDKLIFIETMKIDEQTLVLKICDTAGGIDTKIIERVFEPYFTTKHQSVGTGLGLSMSHKIITQRHNQKISVDNKTFEYNNKQYKGACFTITFKLDSVNKS